MIGSKAVALLGAGTQGRRLAYMVPKGWVGLESANLILGLKWSSQGRPVRLIDSQPGQLQDSLRAIDDLRSSSGRDTKWGTVSTHSSDDLTSTLRGTWLVVECVPERLPLKRQVMEQIEAAAPEDTIIASNSSSYTGSEILAGLTLKSDRRVLSAHTYWPPETSAIEIMGHGKTDPYCIDVMMEQCKLHGFAPFHVKGDSLGYIYNRIWAAIKRESLLAASEGIATPQEIDEIFKEVLKTPKGPFEQMDVVGLDVVRDIEEHYAESRGNITSEPRKYLDRFIQDGKLGVKSGRGFYEYNNK